MAQQPTVITTPTGVALYPWLSKPDTKFSTEGEYKVNLVLSAEEAKPLIETINEVFTLNVQEEMEKQKKKDLKTANPPYSDELDDNGQATGNVIFKFKSKAAYKPALFDAKGTTMVGSNIWGGSEVRVNASVSPYFTPTVGAGVALRLRAVQIIALVEGSEGAGRFGFEETTGYVHAEKDAGAQVFEEGGTVPEPKATPSEPEPEVVKTQPTDDGSKDIADIVSKWGAK
jgi:hypothetical protein